MHVLLVEDEPMQRDLVAFALRKAKYEVHACSTVQEAIEVLDNTRLCVAVVDVELQDDNGFDVIKEIQARNLLTKVIVHTAYSSFDTAKESIDHGVFGYVEKSMGLQPLLSQVDKAAAACMRDSLLAANREIKLQVGMLDSLQECVLATDLNMHVVYANRSMQTLLDCNERQILQQKATSFFSLLSHESVDLETAIATKLPNDDKPLRFEAEVQLSIKASPPDCDNAALPESIYRLTISEMRDVPHRIAGYVWVLSDITQQRGAELELEKVRQVANHAQRVSSVGQMAGVLAHELNQPHSAIANFVGGLMVALRSSKVSNEEILSVLQKIQEQAIRAGSIISTLRSYTSKETTRVVTVLVNDVIQDAIRLLQPEFKMHRVKFRTELSQVPLRIAGDGLQLSQVFVNLLKNAIEATSESSSESRLVIVESKIQGVQVLITIIDDGLVLTEDQIAKFFEPYFTTKKDGLGLGMSLSRTIVEQHGGCIHLMPNPTRGLRVEILLPMLG